MAYEFRKRFLQIDEEDETYGAEWGTPQSQHIAIAAISADMVILGRGGLTVAQFRAQYNIPASGPEFDDFTILRQAAQAAPDGLLAAAAHIEAILATWENDDHPLVGHITPQDIMDRLDEIGSPSPPA